MSGPRVKPGDLLGGKFKVERVLGAGGMGLVVAARHAELGQRVAVKLMLKEALADPTAAERFSREARAAVQLQSVHTARVLDVGKLNNGEPYMVMEYLEGQDLDAVLRQSGPLAPAVAVEYVLQACEAIGEAHALGMIHRDIKPKNLYLAQRVDGRPLVKVLDFGLAKTLGGMGDVSLTATTAVFGSPQYMSPEQMRSARDADARSDIWSIGVCLYELVTGRVPFDGAGLAEICATVLKDPLEPPSRWAIGLDPGLDAVIVKCLAKDPADRFQTVADLAFALEPHAVQAAGAASRILHVMQTARKTDLPTIVTDGDVNRGPNTIAGWLEGDPERARRRSARYYVVAAALAVAGVAFVVMIVATVAHETKATRVPEMAAASAQSPAEPPPPSEPPPEPFPAPPIAVVQPPAPVTTGPSGLPAHVLGASPMTDAKGKKLPPPPAGRPPPGRAPTAAPPPPDRGY